MANIKLENVSINDFGQICRTCSSNSNLKNLYDNFNVIYMLETCTQLEYNKTGELLPDKICIDCLLKLRQCFEFIHNCKKTDEILRKCIINQQDNTGIFECFIKTEENTLDTEVKIENINIPQRNEFNCDDLFNCNIKEENTLHSELDIKNESKIEQIEQTNTMYNNIKVSNDLLPHIKLETERTYQTCRKLNESPDEAYLRRLKQTEQRRKLREMQRYPHVSPEVEQMHRMQSAAQMQKYRAWRRSTESPEEAHLRRQQSNERKKLKRQMESPEEAALRRAKAAEDRRRYRAIQRALESPEEAAMRKARDALKKRIHRQSLKCFQIN